VEDNTHLVAFSVIFTGDMEEWKYEQNYQMDLVYGQLFGCYPSKCFNWIWRN